MTEAKGSRLEALKGALGSRLKALKVVGPNGPKLEGKICATISVIQQK